MALSDCPNCRTPRKESEDICPSCGLIFAKWGGAPAASARAAAEPAPTAGKPAPPEPAPIRPRPAPRSGHRDTIILFLLFLTAAAVWYSEGQPEESSEAPVKIGAGRARKAAAKPVDAPLWASPPGLPAGAWKDVEERWSDETPMRVAYYVDAGGGNRKVRAVEYHANGRMKTDTHFDGKLRHGKHLEWFEDGRKRQESKFEFGKRKGSFLSWYESGALECEGALLRGKGRLKCWGEVSREPFYKNFEETY